MTHGKQVQIWRTPTLEVEFAPFVLHRTYAGHDDDVLHLEWSADSRCVCPRLGGCGRDDLPSDRDMASWRTAHARAGCC